jgi:O-antigen/teichoic acid export membrane protein
MAALGIHGGVLMEKEKQQRALGSRVANGTLWGAMNMALGRVLQFTTTIIVARMLAPEHFGALAVALVVQVIATNMAELGATASLARGNGDPDKIAPTVFTIALGTSALLTVLAVALAPYLAAVFGDPEATPVIQVLSLTIMLQGLSAVPSTMVWREYLQKPRIVVDTANLVVVLALVVPMAGAGWGAMALAWSRVGGQLVAAIGYWVITPKRYLPGFNRGVATEVLRLGLPLAMANLVVFVTLNLDYLLVGRIMGPVELGIYLMAFNLASLPSAVITAVIRSVAVPTFGRLHEQGTLGEASVRFVAGVSYVAFPISALLIALAHPLIVTVYGEKWASAAAIMVGLGIFGAVRILVELFSDLGVGAGRTVGLFWIQLAWLVALAPALFLGINWWGVSGAGVAHAVVACLVVVPLYLRVLRSVLGVSAARLLRGCLGPALAASVSAVAGWAIAMLAPTPLLAVGIGGFTVIAIYIALTFRTAARLVALIRVSARGTTRKDMKTQVPPVVMVPSSAMIPSAELKEP